MYISGKESLYFQRRNQKGSPPDWFLIGEGLDLRQMSFYALNLPFSGVLLYLGSVLTEWEKEQFNLIPPKLSEWTMIRSVAASSRSTLVCPVDYHAV